LKPANNLINADHSTKRIIIPKFIQVKNIYILLLALLLINLKAQSQSYPNAIGLRMGTCGGLSYRKIMDKDLAGELQLSGYRHSTIITFLVEKHRPTLIHDFPLTLFYGAGVHVGAGRSYYNDGWFFNDPEDLHDDYRFSPKAGIDGFAALEYELDRYPVTISLECKPFLEFFDCGFPGLHLPAIAAAVRYTF